MQIAGLIENQMKESGINFIGPSVPTKIEKLEGIIFLRVYEYSNRLDGKLKVYYTNPDNEIGSDVYDTVMFAIGRTPDTQV
jgi:hypothetical protein